jgi:hypothetical protein
MTAPGAACPSANEGVCTSFAHIEQLRQENAALKERIEQMEWER